jgi:nitroreductase
LETREAFIPLQFERLSLENQSERAREFLANLQRRRTVRDFSSEPVPFEIVSMAIETAATAPSGANQQPWRFVVISDPEIKRQIRLAAEEEERQNYEHRFPQHWKDALAPLGTDWHKEFLEIAPYLIVIFAIVYGETPSPVADGTFVQSKHYYVNESVGIAAGMLIAALHNAGLATLTHTPSPMGFLTRILGRPKNERPYLLIPVGYPAQGCLVPNIKKKSVDEVMIKI